MNRQTLGNMHSLEIKTTKPTTLDSWDLRPLEAQDFKVLEALIVTVRPRKHGL